MSREPFFNDVGQGARRAILALGLFVGASLPTLTPLEAQPRRDQMNRERVRQERMAERRQRPQRSRTNAIERHFFAPEMVMRMQEEIALTAEQRDHLIAELQAAQSDMVPLQFEVKEAQAALGKLVKEPNLAEETVVTQAQRVMAAEAAVRVRHLTLLVRVKNLLTADQKEQLQELRNRLREDRFPERLRE